MYPETLLPQPLLSNSAFHATIALIYSASIFAVDRTLRTPHVFDKSSPLRTAFGYVAICSWPVLLFGALILVAVRVGANVRRRRRHRRRSRRRKRASRTSSKSRDASASVSATPDKKRRASSAPPSVKPPSPIASTLAQQSVSADAASTHKRVHSDNMLNSTRVPPPSTVYVKPADRERSERSERSGLSGLSDPSERSERTDDMHKPPPRLADAGHGRHDSRHTSHHSGRSSKRSKSSRGTAISDMLPSGYISVTRGQKAFAAMGFLWVSAGLAATSAAGLLVFLGMREMFRTSIDNLGAGGQVEVHEWAIASFSGLLFFVLFGALCLSTLVKCFKALGRTPTDMEIRTVSLDDPDMRDMDLEAGNSPAYTRTHSQAHAHAQVHVSIDARGGEVADDEDDESDDGSESDGEDSEDGDSVELGAGAAVLVDGSDDGVSMETEDWRSLYMKGADLPFQADVKTVERMMRQLRDMGFSNPHQNIAALQASSFDLELASDKLSNAQME